MKRLPLAAGILASGLLAGCVVGPNYHRPPVQAPTAYKTEGPWRVAAPKDSLPKGAWWEIFNDAELNNYEQQLLNANQSLARGQRPPERGAFAGPSRLGGILSHHERRSQRCAHQVFGTSS